MLLAKTKLNTMEVLIFKALIDSNINHDKFISVISLLREYNKMKEDIINPENVVYYIVEKQWKHSVSVRTKKTLILVSNCAICRKKENQLIKYQEASRLLRKLGIRIPLSNIPLTGDTLY